ncbi:hypothetical protein PC129_g22145 [Phytophthora cactorum]|nr:hypothetical protein PC112_g9450 [Phytophthora cactorum]KAG2908616.1 hypothetical protein PC114_g10404 [Phytophthora cactorum]KAG2941438.1 hypothetical protein PC117_g10242 [Phytophthora cactorum]KAG2982734.1 hypothetical protein PC120_g24580 [Phytophthora cactorum]KAG3086614.1 hypothetical protein PC122_g9202 [Phytophthora cactorum]
MVDILYRIAPADYDNDPELCSARRRLSIMETLNGGEIRYIADWFNADLRRVVEDAKEKLFEPRNAVKAYRRTSKIHDTLVISAFQLRLSDELENIKKFVKKCVEVVNLVEAIPSIILVGFASLNIDVDVQMWVNIALVGPSIRVTTSQGFDFSALGQAKCAKHMNSVDGENGSHGTCGLPGGNLTVVCQQLQDDSHILRSTVSRGQRGGDAQDGGDGVHGTDSIYCKATFEKAIKWEIKHRLLKDDPRELRDGLQLVKYERDDCGAIWSQPDELQSCSAKLVDTRATQCLLESHLRLESPRQC